MQVRSFVCGAAAIGALVIGRGQAHADAKADAIIKVRQELSAVWQIVREDSYARLSAYDAQSARTVDGCLAAIDTARAAGVKDDDKLAGYMAFYKHPKEVDPTEGDSYILFKDAPSVCEAFAPVYRKGMATAHCEAAHFSLDAVGKKEVKGAYVSEAESMIRDSDACVAAVDALIAADGDLELNFWRANDLKIKASEAKAKYGAPLRALAEQLKADIEGLAAGNAATIKKRFTDVGIKGDRLELFIYYADIDEENSGWLAPGCERYVTKAKDLKKAKKLFQWLTDSYGVITVRKYTFKGDKYKVSERQYYTEAAAYKGCR